MLALIFFVSLSGGQAATDTPVREASAPAPSRQRLICRSRPMLGSRVTQRRVCKTAEEWAIYENDMEQSRRDIADRGARGCDMRRQSEC